MVTEFEEHVKFFPASLWDHLKLAVREWLYRRRHLCFLARRIHVKLDELVYWKPRDIQITTEDLLVSINMQIHYLYRLGLKPRAIICHPEVAERLWPLYLPNMPVKDNAETVGVEYPRRGISRVFGLPIVVESDIQTRSAYVV